MNEEEKKAIERLEEQLNFWKKQNIKNSDCEIILNLITKLQKENEEKDRKMKKYLDIISKNIIETIKDELVQQKNKELDFKDKQIDLMAGEIEYAGCIKKVWGCDEKDCIACIKQYFETKAKKGE